MVYQHSIPFGAPSQLRLLIAADADGQAEVAVLDAFNQPIGNLKNMRTQLKDLKAVVEIPEAVAEARNDKAVCQLKLDEESSDEIEVQYEDLERNRKIRSTVTVEDFKELLDQLLKGQ